MNNIKELQEIWSSHEVKLQQQWKINLDLLRKINLDKIERKMNRLIWIKAIALGFYMIVAFLLVGFVISVWPEPNLAISGTLIFAWAISVCFTSIQELKMILTINYADAVPDLQSHLLNLRRSIIRFLRIGAWILPLHLAFIVVFFNLIFGINIAEVGNKVWLISQLVISIFIMIPLAVWIHRKLVPENADKKWMYNLLRGNGAQITDSIRLLEEIEDFKQEK